MAHPGLTFAAGRAPAPEAKAALVLCPLFAGLAASEVEAIAAEASVHTARPQETIYDEGDPCRGLWILASGRARLQHSIADGRTQVVAFRAPVAPLEPGPALDGRGYMSTAVAVDECALLFLSRPRLVEVLRRHPRVLSNIIDGLCLEIRQRDILTANAALKDARGRVGCTLLQLSHQFGAPAGDGGVRINYRLTRQDIADRAGVTIETAIRVLSDLQRRHVVRTDAQVIDVQDLGGLRSVTECGDCQFDCSVFAPGNARR
jgi:CRP/FNR family transcriptional regulator